MKFLSYAISFFNNKFYCFINYWIYIYIFFILMTSLNLIVEVNKKIFIALIIIVLATATLILKDYLKPIEQPSYKVLLSEGKFEIREYPYLEVADIVITGDQIFTLKEGFKSLASYISGENALAKKINMTAPVLQTQVDYQWKVSFIMPKNTHIKDLPLPLDKKIRLGIFPKRKILALTFSGNITEINLDNNYQLIKEYVKNKNIVTVGKPIYAFYNPPWIPPFMKRNEILLEVIS